MTRSPLDTSLAAPLAVAPAAWPLARERLLLFACAALVVAFAILSAHRAVDFPVYHRIATQIRQGNFELYPPEVYTGAAAPPHGFRYAPAIAFLFVPLAWLSLEHAALFFFLLKVGAIFYVGAAVMRQAGRRTRSRTVLLLALACVGGYVAEELRYGNVHFFVVALLVYAFEAAASGAVFAPAAALGLAIATKITPLLMLGYFLMRKRFAVCAATVGVLAVLALAPAVVVGLRTNVHLLEGFARYAVEKIDEGDNYALRGVLVRYGMPAADAAWLLTVIVGGVVVGAAIRRAPAGPLPAALDLSILLTAMLLASPHTQRRYLIALFVPVVALLASLPTTGDESDRRVMLFGVIATAATSTVLPALFAGHRLALDYEAGSPYFFGTFALFVALVWLRVTAQRRSAPA